MKRATFYFAIAVGVLLGSVLITIALFMAIDINSYKSEIESLVLEKTGRKLHIEGDIERSLFPWLGVRVATVRLSNAPGFGQQDFVIIQSADIRVKVSPLFFGKLEVDVLTLKGLKLNLARNADGVTNWDDLIVSVEKSSGNATLTTPPDVATSPPEPPPIEALAALSLGGIRLQDAQLSWQDEVENQTIQLNPINWEVSEIKADTPIAYQLNVHFNSNAPEVSGQLTSEGTIRAELKREYYQLSSLSLGINAQGKAIPGGQLDVKLATGINFDYKHQTLDIKAFTLETLGLTLSAALAGKEIINNATVNGNLKLAVIDEMPLLNILNALVPENHLSIQPGLLKQAELSSHFTVGIETDSLAVESLNFHSQYIKLKSQWNVELLKQSPQYKGSMQLETFSPKNLMQALAVEIPKTSDPEVLQNADLALKISGSTNKINVTEIKANLDKTHIDARISVNDFTKPAITLGVELDRINLDSYLPPTTTDDAAPIDSGEKPDAAVSATPQATSSAEVLAPLKTLNLSAKVFVKALTVANAQLQYIDADIKAKNGIVDIRPLKFNLYDGATLTNLKLNAQGATPKLTVNNTSTSIATGPLLRDVYGDDVMTGVANMQFDISAEGMDADAITKTLNGKGNFLISDGVLDVDLETYFDNTYQKYKKLTKKPRENIKKTAFEKIGGSYTLSNGVLTNNDLNGKLRRYRISGRGKIDLPEQQIDYLLDTTVVKTSDANKDQPVAELQGHTIPTSIRGPLADPKIKPDFKAVAKAAAKKAIKKEQRKLEEKAKKSIDKEVDKLEEKYDIELDDLKDKLKGIF